MTLSRQDTSFLKGIAILMIAMHNFCHWLPMAITENEYTFQGDRIAKYVGYLENMRPHVVLNFISHFGHYGVPLFLFLSGYGLVKKYERSEAKAVSVARFMWQHATKLWKLLIPAVLLFMLTETIFHGGYEKAWYWAPLLTTFTSNLLPTTNLILGPWWFFSLIMQFYLLYRLVFQIHRGNLLLWSVVGASLLLQMGLYAADTHFCCFGREVYAMEYVRYNSVGHLLPFALGIQMARKEWKFYPWLTMLAGWLLCLAAAFNVWLWFFSPLFAVMALLPLAQLIRQGVFRRTMERVGPISAAVFVFHPIVRQYTILPAGRAVRWGEPTLVYGEILLYLVITLTIAWAYTTAIAKWKSRRS